MFPLPAPSRVHLFASSYGTPLGHPRYIRPSPALLFRAFDIHLPQIFNFGISVSVRLINRWWSIVYAQTETEITEITEIDIQNDGWRMAVDGSLSIVLIFSNILSQQPTAIRQILRHTRKTATSTFVEVAVLRSSFQGET